jgi:hypothetical protein
VGDYIFCLAVLPVVAWGVWVCAREPRHLAPVIRDTSDLTSAEASRVLDALREDATPKSASALWQEPGDA